MGRCYNLIMGHLAVFALGPLRIELNGRPLQTSRRKALALLVYLALNRDRQSREMLAAFFWPEYPQQKAFAYLRRTLWEIRKLLGEDWLDTDRIEAGFHPDISLMLDIEAFQSHLESLNRHQHSGAAICQECTAHLRKAALLYRGDFLSGFSLRDSHNFDEWQLFYREALRRDYAEALQKLSYLLFQSGNFIEATNFARRWLALDTFNEEAHRLLMKIYSLNGQRHAALRQYQECRQILQTDLGITPEPATNRLYEIIATGKHDQKTEIHPQWLENQVQEILQEGLVSVELVDNDQIQTTRPCGNLPNPPTPFIGRQQEVQQITTRLSYRDCWLLTLLGPGGIGKTRLAIQAGNNLIDQFSQGVFFISLSMVQNEQSIVPAIARSLGLSFRFNGTPPKEQLLDFLRKKHLLLILDSFEGLVQWSNYIAQIHTHCPETRMLVTSRHKLNLPGESVLVVKGLNYPLEPDGLAGALTSEVILSHSAVELFLQAASRNKVTFQATRNDLNAISQITRILEGMPLGLELAATWVNTLSCEEIAAEIDRGLDILESPLGVISERQRSMRAVLNHSWDLISNREQVLLPRLAVFRGHFSRQAAEQVAGITYRELIGLVDKSLVRCSASGRFDLHDLLRQYCLGKLEQSPGNFIETNHRHCAFFSRRLYQWNLELGSPLQGEALREMEAELKNLQAAWEWAVHQKQFAFLKQAVDGLCMFYLRKARFSEGREACNEAVEIISTRLSSNDTVRIAQLSSRLHTWQAVFSLNLERFEEVEQFLQASQRILDDVHLESEQMVQEHIFFLVIQALFANLRFDTRTMLASYNEAFRLSHKAKERSPRILTYGWRFLMGGAVTQELYTQMEKNLADVRQCGDPFELGCHLFVLGNGELFHKFQPSEAEPLLMESVNHFRIANEPSTQPMITKTLGYLLLVQGNFEECLGLKQHELEIVQNLGDRRMIGVAHAEIGEIYYHMGKTHQAEEQLRTAISLLQGHSDYEVAHRHRYLGDVLLAQGKYPEALEVYRFSFQFFQKNSEKGWMLTALTGISRAELALGDRESAWDHALQALTLFNEMQLYTFFVYLTVAGFALLLADQGQVITALELFGMILRQGFLSKSCWFSALYGKRIETAAAHLSEEERYAATTRGQKLDFSRTIQMLLDLGSQKETR